MFDVWYWAVLECNKDGRYFAHVPDLPGATAAGDSEREVLQNIAEIAADHVRDLVEDGHEVPKARSTDEIERDPEIQEYGRAAVPIDVPGRSTKISLSIDEALLKRIDRAATKAGMTRSGFFAAAAQDRIQQQADRGLLRERFVSEGSFARAVAVRSSSPMLEAGRLTRDDELILVEDSDETDERYVVLGKLHGGDVVRTRRGPGRRAIPLHSRAPRRERSKDKD